MGNTMANAPEYHGSVVSFEGPQDITSTQLRLLPSSSNILVIPPLQHLITPPSDSPFEARSYVLKMHEACNARAEMARSFLRDSTPDNKRLVFMNGGTASALMSCVTAISKHVTDGDITRAETIFNEIVQDGTGGLRRPERDVSTIESQYATMTSEQAYRQSVFFPEDPVSRAMREADALDFETASLQPSSGPDLPFATRCRSTSVPTSHIADDCQESESAPFYIFGPGEHLQPSSHQGQRGAIARGLNRCGLRDGHTCQHPEIATWRAKTAVEDQLDDPNSEPLSPNSVGVAYPNATLSPPGLDVLSPQSAAFGSTPTTPAIIGQALVVDVRPSASATFYKKVKAVDLLYATAVRNQDVSLCKFSTPIRIGLQEAHDASASKEVRADACQEKPDLRSKFCSEIARPRFLKPSKTIIRRNLPPALSLGRNAKNPRASYINQSTNPAQSYKHRSTSTQSTHVSRETGAEDITSFLVLEDDHELGADCPFHTVLPMIEDLVINFKSEESDPRLEATIQLFREGTYPISMPTLLPEHEEDEEGFEQPSTPNSSPSTSTTTGSQTTVSQVESAEESPAFQSYQDEYDPFACRGDYPQPPSIMSTKQHDMPSGLTAVAVPAPPTPAQTPPPTVRTSDKSFHDFNTTSFGTALCIQNSLRSILSTYFPAEGLGHHLSSFPLLPEMNSIWKPVFRDEEPGNPRKKKKRRIDLILAIGAEKGVDREFLGAITGSMEKLGAKPNGVTRSGRVDLKYLIANVMQAFTMQPLASQIQDNPFSNPFHLATLILPYLETYMAAHSATRFLLLEYPPEHLTTVLALQRLVGVDLLKVAGILDSEANEPKSHKGFKVQPPITTPTTSFPGTSTAEKTSAGLPASSEANAVEAPSFSKANLLLTSSATESEVATLVSTIWKILVDTSTFYIPDGAAPKSPVPRQNSNKRDARDRRPLAQIPLIDQEQQQHDTPLSNAASMMGFLKPPNLAPSNYVSSGTCMDNASSFPFPFPAPPIPQGAAAEDAQARPSTASVKSGRTTKTTHSQRTKLRHMLGRDDVGIASGDNNKHSAVTSYLEVSGDDDDHDDGEDEDGRFAAEERKYMPLWCQPPSCPRKGSSRKALKWLGLAT